jgi:hypothetical protein
LLIALIVIQFFRPSKNISEVISINDIKTKYTVPGEVEDILKVSCNDCHSNNSQYPWYWHMQPVAWFMNDHIIEGKRHLNFSAFASYEIARQYKLFENINREVKGGDMPLTSYTLIHRDAILNDIQKAAIANWTAESRKQIKAAYPADSLIMKKPNRTQ